MTVGLNLIILTFTWLCWPYLSVANRSISLVSLVSVIGIGFGISIFAVLNLGIHHHFLAPRPLLAAAKTPLLKLIVGRPTTVRTTLNNFSDSPIVILGFNSSCGCLAVNTTRKTIPPHMNETLEFVLNPKNSAFLGNEFYII